MPVARKKSASGRTLSPSMTQIDGRYVGPELGKPTLAHLLNQAYLAPTGETVPRPGVPQLAGATPLDHAIRQENDRIDNSICNGC